MRPPILNRVFLVLVTADNAMIQPMGGENIRCGVRAGGSEFG